MKIVREKGWHIIDRKKWQRREGRFKAISYFLNIKENKLTWAKALLNDGKVDLYGENADGIEY